MNENASLTLTCVAKSVYPNPAIEWLADGKRLSGSLLSVEYNLTDRSAISVLASVAKPEDNNKNIECRVYNIYTQLNWTAAKTLDVRFEPIIRCEATTADVAVDDQHTVGRMQGFGSGSAEAALKSTASKTLIE